MQRIGGISLIAGAILTVVGNFLAPRPDDPSSMGSYVNLWASKPDQTRIAFFAILLGLWALIFGFAAIYRSLTAAGASAWVRLGFYGTLAATAVFSVALALGLAGVKEAASGASMTASATTLAAATDSAFGVSFLAYWAAMLFTGIGIAMSTVYPKWTGWLLIISGVVAAVFGGILRIFDGTSQTTELIFGAGALITSVVALVLGIVITRREMKAM